MFFEAPNHFGVNWAGFWVFSVLLVVLQILHIFWFYLIAKMIHRLISTGIEKGMTYLITLTHSIIHTLHAFNSSPNTSSCHTVYHTLSAHPLTPPYQPTLSTHPINTPYQPTLPILSIHSLSTPFQPVLSTHPLNTNPHHQTSTHPVQTNDRTMKRKWAMTIAPYQVIHSPYTFPFLHISLFTFPLLTHFPLTHFPSHI